MERILHHLEKILCICIGHGLSHVSIDLRPYGLVLDPQLGFFNRKNVLGLKYQAYGQPANLHQSY